jgi:hypothetical protein
MNEQSKMGKKLAAGLNPMDPEIRRFSLEDFLQDLEGVSNGSVLSAFNPLARVFPSTGRCLDWF